MSTCLEELHAEFICKGLTLLRENQLLVSHVGFVSNQHALYILPPVCVLLDLPDPVADVIETVLAGAVVGKHHPLGILEVILSDVAISFLACRVPDLQFHCLIIHLYVFDLEIYADCRYKGWSEVLVSEF